MAFPTTSILDSFTGADQNPLAGNWTKATYGTFNDLKRVSNAVTTATSNSNDCLDYWNASDFGPDVEIYITAASVSSDTFILLGARYTSGGNGYKIDWDNGTSRVRVWRDDAGVRTQLGANITQSMSNGDSIGMSIIGSTITIYYKASGGSWTSIGTRTDSTYTSSGRLQLGMWLFSSGETIDNFGGGTINHIATPSKSNVKIITGATSSSKSKSAISSPSKRLINIITNATSASKGSNKTVQLTKTLIVIQTNNTTASSGVAPTDNKTATPSKQSITVLTNTTSASKSVVKTASVTKVLISVNINSPTVTISREKTANSSKVLITVSSGALTVSKISIKTSSLVKSLITVRTNSTTGSIPSSASGITVTILLRSLIEKRINYASRMDKFINKDDYQNRINGIEKRINLASKVPNV